MARATISSSRDEVVAMEVAEARREAVGVDQGQVWVTISLKVQPCPYNLNTRRVAHRLREASIMQVVGGVVEAVVATTTSMAVVAMKALQINLLMVATTTSISLLNSTKSSTGLVSPIVKAILTNTRCSQLRINNPIRCFSSSGNGGGGSKAVWNFSENSSVLVGPSVPYFSEERVARPA